jgi:hypothetical protein
MRKLVVLTALLVAVTVVAAAFPSNSDAFFLVWTPDGGSFMPRFGGGYGSGGYGGSYGGYDCGGWYGSAASYGYGYRY